MYETPPEFGDYVSKGPISEFKNHWVVVRIKGMDGIYDVDASKLNYADNDRLCDIGKKPYFKGPTYWALTKDVEVLAVLGAGEYTFKTRE